MDISSGKPKTLLNVCCALYGLLMLFIFFYYCTTLVQQSNQKSLDIRLTNLEQNLKEVINQKFDYHQQDLHSKFAQQLANVKNHTDLSFLYHSFWQIIVLIFSFFIWAKYLRHM